MSEVLSLSRRIARFILSGFQPSPSLHQRLSCLKSNGTSDTLPQESGTSPEFILQGFVTPSHFGIDSSHSRISFDAASPSICSSAAPVTALPPEAIPRIS